MSYDEAEYLRRNITSNNHAVKWRAETFSFGEYVVIRPYYGEYKPDIKTVFTNNALHEVFPGKFFSARKAEEKAIELNDH